MKKMKKMRIMLLLAAMIWCLAGSTGMAASKVTLKLSASKVTLVKGKTKTLKASVKGTRSKVTWKSSRPSVASVSKNGKITAKKAGTAVITAKVKGVKKTCKVTVSNPPKISYKKLRGKSFAYKNSKFLYKIYFGKSNNKVYLGVWNPSGTSASYEDFQFYVKEGRSTYTLTGLRSRYKYKLVLTPGSNSVKVNLRCAKTSYAYFNINKKFSYSGKSNRVI
mgnify:FL=1